MLATRGLTRLPSALRNPGRALPLHERRSGGVSVHHRPGELHVFLDDPDGDGIEPRLERPAPAAPGAWTP